MKAKPPLEMSGWREAHIGFEDDGLKIDGVEVWKQKWRSPDRQSVQLPHPAHPQQLHRYVIHEVGDARHPLRFAACELSNGVWGFFVPMEEAAAAPQAGANTSPISQTVSPDGTIRVDLAAVEWSNSHWVNAPRVTDLASGKIVLDLWNTDWDAVPSFPANRRLRLECRRYHVGGGLAVELDLARGTYRIFVGSSHQDPLPEAPLAGIAQGMEAASRKVAGTVAVARGHGASIEVTPLHALAAWRTALLMLVGALVLMALVAFLAMHYASATPQKLDTVPARSQ
jgi:hypothetical protein